MHSPLSTSSFTLSATKSILSRIMFTWSTFSLQKLAYLRTEEQGRYADDIIHAYGFEGVGSPAGSVGCCSDQVNQEDLDFLNTLGPKFKVLAEVCTNKWTRKIYCNIVFTTESVLSCLFFVNYYELGWHAIIIKGDTKHWVSHHTELLKLFVG